MGPLSNLSAVFAVFAGHPTEQLFKISATSSRNWTAPPWSGFPASATRPSSSRERRSPRSDVVGVGSIASSLTGIGHQQPDFSRRTFLLMGVGSVPFLKVEVCLVIFAAPSQDCPSKACPSACASPDLTAAADRLWVFPCSCRYLHVKKSVPYGIRFRVGGTNSATFALILVL